MLTYPRQAAWGGGCLLSKKHKHFLKGVERYSIYMRHFGQCIIVWFNLCSHLGPAHNQFWSYWYSCLGFGFPWKATFQSGWSPIYVQATTMIA